MWPCRCHRFDCVRFPTSAPDQWPYRVKVTALDTSPWLNDVNRCCWPLGCWAGKPPPKNPMASWKLSLSVLCVTRRGKVFLLRWCKGTCSFQFNNTKLSNLVWVRISLIIYFLKFLLICQPSCRENFSLLKNDGTFLSDIPGNGVPFNSHSYCLTINIYK